MFDLNQLVEAVTLAFCRQSDSKKLNSYALQTQVIEKRQTAHLIEAVHCLYDIDVPLKFKLFMLLNGHYDSACSKCSNKLDNAVQTDTDFLCNKCRNMRRYESTKQTLLDRYGVVASSQVSEFKDKAVRSFALRDKDAIRAKYESTMLEKHGVKYPLQSDHIMNKFKNTVLDRYGVKHVSYLPEVQAKRALTCLDRYGETTNLKTTDTKTKIRNTCLEVYGVVNPMQNSLVFNKKNSTCIERYGVDNIFKSDDFKQSLKKANALRYSDIGREIYLNDPSGDKLYELCCSVLWDMRQLVVLTGISITTLYIMLEQKGFINKREPISSWEEKHFASVIEETFGCSVVRNTKKIISPYEIDIWIPEHNIGIEYNGVYWHSFGSPDRHLKKYLNACSAGIKLLQFFSDEVMDDMSTCLDIISYFITGEPSIINYESRYWYDDLRFSVGNIFDGEFIKRTPPKMLIREGHECYDCGYDLYSIG